MLSNDYFQALETETWEVHEVASSGKRQYKAAGKELYMLSTDLLFKWDPVLSSYAVEYASDNALFLQDFQTAWLKLVNRDRYDGPTGNACDAPSAAPVLHASE